jgi:hypothetical protein
MEELVHRKLLLALGLVLLAGLTFASPVAASSRHAQTAVVDFSAIGSGNNMPPDYFEPEGVQFAPQQCYGSPACHPWFVGWIQGDDAIGGGQYGGPIVAQFIWPVADVSVSVAPAYQFKAKYVLTAFDADGGLVARKVIVESQDQGLPGLSPFGYFTISLENLTRPACRFSIRTYFVAASNPANKIADFGLSTIKLRFQNTRAASRC